MIAALYVDPNGSYYGLPGVELWTKFRDARTYAGPHPVVAHPPCQTWGRFAHRALDENDEGCFAAALEAVRRWGGVLEHPAGSNAWQQHGLRRPLLAGWQRDIDGGWCCRVEQAWYGHKARKPTWLYAMADDLPNLHWGPHPQIISASYAAAHGYEKARRAGMLSMYGGKWKTEMREMTPPAFRDVLIAIAEKGRPMPEAPSSPILPPRPESSRDGNPC
jgi:hypothetical protein